MSHLQAITGPPTEPPPRTLAEVGAEVETLTRVLELQAVYIASLETRIETLEAAAGGGP